MNQELFKTDEIASAITRIIDESQKYCFIVTPYYNVWDQLAKSLAKAAQQQKKLVFFIRYEVDYVEGGINYKRIKVLIDYGFDVVYVKNLHAKLYMNEKEILVTSLNMYDKSVRANFELGINIRGRSEYFKKNFIENELLGAKEYYGQNGLEECYRIVEGRYFAEKREREEEEKKKEEERLQAEMKRKEERAQLLSERNSKLENNENKGFCIRCGTVIPLDSTRPFCLDCYKKWASWGNYDWQEKYCHVCGKEFNNISMRKPCCSQHLKSQNKPSYF